MFIDFEGIDGSGKTTLSNRLAKRLRLEGLSVTHAREGGDLPSAIARTIRAMTRDAANLEITDEAELLLYCARDAQLLEDTIRPALARGEVVIADRYLYSHEALSVHGRGLPADRVHSILDAVADGIWPDLVILIDVDPAVARIRKRCGKLGIEPGTGGGRKGLAGPGLLHRLREGFLAMARARPDRFRVILADDLPLDEVDRCVWEAVLARLPSRPLPRAHQRRRAPPPVPPTPERPATFECHGSGREDRLLAAFLARARELAARQPAAAALFLGTARGAAVEELREKLVTLAPDAVARSLADRADDVAMELRERLVSIAGREVAASLARLPGPRAVALRERVAVEFPTIVVAGLAGDAGEAAWSLRERLLPAMPGAVTASLAHIGGERAHEFRLRARALGVTADDLLASLAGIDDDGGWALRVELTRWGSTLAHLRSLAGCLRDAAWPVRAEWLARAPRPVLKGLRGLDDPRAWQLRFEAGPGAREALDSVVGLGGLDAAELRQLLTPYWPAAVVSSLEGLVAPDAATAMWNVVERWGGLPAVLRAAAQRIVPAGRLREAA